MVYLVIKELSTVAEDVIMVTSSLMKDMQPTSEVMYRANAIRVLRKITDVGPLRFVYCSYLSTPGTVRLVIDIFIYSNHSRHQCCKDWSDF